ncbi:uncharacterized protein LOC116926572 [Daphnia magna]|uniref:Uncharacterized protein n=1 Tax=Daphnia magna TaxID=35525 RepID=A0ABR0AL30_9CRUS|nr:uncharacterized protein LOC116926572 [Daphnia magna]KAK4025693.1 hypothetical protein OUZ56_014743 [Daphnia magna]
MIRIWLLLVTGSIVVVFNNVETTAHEELVMLNTGDGATKEPEEEVSVGRRSSRRTALSLPANTSCKISFDMSVGISPLNNTFTSFTMSLPFRFVLPTHSQLNHLYGNLERLESDLSDGEATTKVIDYEFLEEQRANEQRRTIYQHIETLFKKFGLDGELCLQRAICELAEAPLGHYGMLGKLIHLVFSPSLLQFPEIMSRFLAGHGNANRFRRDASLLPELELIEKPVEDQYTRAYLAGKGRKCWARYSSCPISLFTLLKI